MNPLGIFYKHLVPSFLSNRRCFFQSKIHYLSIHKIDGTMARFRTAIKTAFAKRPIGLSKYFGACFSLFCRVRLPTFGNFFSPFFCGRGKYHVWKAHLRLVRYKQQLQAIIKSKSNLVKYCVERNKQHIAGVYYDIWYSCAVMMIVLPWTITPCLYVHRSEPSY